MLERAGADGPRLLSTSLEAIARVLSSLAMIPTENVLAQTLSDLQRYKPDSFGPIGPEDPQPRSKPAGTPPLQAVEFIYCEQIWPIRPRKDYRKGAIR